ncbi:UNC93-like protein [Vigna angularis]|uniref:UNC93-like protein n=1 Tax=Phaseolus angularis TaxID=3914 RepID=A0A8T0JRT4_PHAAN|nr:UNC93-like protein [Vigna angularis]
MLDSVGIGYLLDFNFERRRVRGLMGVVVVGVLGTAIWGGALANQLSLVYWVIGALTDDSEIVNSELGAHNNKLSITLYLVMFVVKDE